MTQPNVPGDVERRWESLTIRSDVAPVPIVFDGPDGEMWRITEDRRFVLAPDIHAQDAAREFAEWVNTSLPSALFRAIPAVPAAPPAVTPEQLRAMAEWFDNPNQSPTFSVVIDGTRFTPGYLLRCIATELEKT